MEAAIHGDKMELDRLIASGVDLEFQNLGTKFDNAVIHAARCGNTDCLDSLIAAGASVNNVATDDDELALAHVLALRGGHKVCVESLIAANASVNPANKWPATAMDFANRYDSDNE